MTVDRKEKQAARERAARTGEAYVQALKAVRKEKIKTVQKSDEE